MEHFQLQHDDKMVSNWRWLAIMFLLLTGTIYLITSSNSGHQARGLHFSPDRS
jgi:hypothetical protein